MKAIICFVHFGSKDEEAKKRFHSLIRNLENQHQGYTVLTYSLSEETEEDLLEKCKGKEDRQILFAALMMEDGRTYRKLLSQVTHFKDAEVTEPLLATDEALQQILHYYKDRSGQTLLVLHGRHHQEDQTAMKLNRMLPDNIRVISMEGTPSVDEVTKEWKKQEVEVYPLMIAGGVHTKEDIQSSKEDSVYSKLRRAGFCPKPAKEHFSESKLLETLVALALEKKLQLFPLFSP